MGKNHPLFDNGRLAASWIVAGSDPKMFPADHRDALLQLAAQRESLPAPVCFTVPQGMERDDRWQRLVDASQPQCGCASRRIMLPTRGRARFVSHPVPKLVELAPALEPPYNSGLLLIAPQGGDMTAAHLAWSFVNGWPCVIQAPGQATCPSYSSIHFSYGGMPPYSEGTLRFDPRELAVLVQLHGEVICYRQIGPISNRVAVPVCSVVKVEAVPGICEYRPVITVELDATVHQIPHDPLRPVHICAPSA